MVGFRFPPTRQVAVEGLQYPRRGILLRAIALGLIVNSAERERCQDSLTTRIVLKK